MFKPTGSDRKRIAADLSARAAQAAAERRFAVAAALYDEALRLEPRNAPMLVQAGHMAKEAGHFADAERHYAEAARQLPQDADLALQQGHFYKTTGRLPEAEKQYRRALSLRHNWEEAQREIDHLTATGLAAAAWTDIGKKPEIDDGAIVNTNDASARKITTDGLVASLFPHPDGTALIRHGESVHLRRLGQDDHSRWGLRRTLRGVEAIRGFCISRDPISEVQVLLNGQVIHRGPVQVFTLSNESDDPYLRKNVFNVWLDFTPYLAGRYHIEVYFRDHRNSRDEHGGWRSYRDYVVIAPPRSDAFPEGGDAWVPPLDPADPRSVEEQINARPSLVRAAARQVLAPPRTILVLRTDQLGDVVGSVPALRRLRELAPQARIVGLLTVANADLARSLDLFDELIIVNFPDVVAERRRVMTAADQQALRDRLRPYAFDVAIDLAPAGESRPLLLLSGAKFTFGMGDRSWPWLDAGFEFNAYDPVGRSNVVSAAAKTLAMIEAFGTLLRDVQAVVRRSELGPDRLTAFGMGSDDQYVVMHTGARVAVSRWEHYNALAQRIVDETSLKVFLLSEEAGVREGMPARLLEHERFTLLDKRLEFDDFDALLSFCTVFVGNDSGPKHLAALRGRNVVSLHLARTNWGEWGQSRGTIISRQVPCAACHIYHDPEECGKDYTCIKRISLDEVFGAVMSYLHPNLRHDDGLSELGR